MTPTVRPRARARLRSSLDALRVVLGRAVGEIQPDDIDAGGDQSGQHLRVGRGRAEGGDDLG